ncbi:MAG: diaminopimelate decarboxylase [Clostridiales bacterium]|nr:diaminopimelate decarboxylase [Clostridiales bacterium]
MNPADTLTQRPFFGNNDPKVLLERFGSPLYVYNEAIFRQRCREMRHLIDYPHFTANYSIKANSNLTLLKIAREEGLHADAMSPGEIFALEQAGFTPDQIFFVPNNVSAHELDYARERQICISLDSLDQLELAGRLSPGLGVAIRINPGLGAGHHAKVITAGKKTKFGINAEQLDEARAIAERLGLRIIGVNQHIGSLFMEPPAYLRAARHFFELAAGFPDLEFVDLGGGFGIPYRKLDGEAKLDLNELRDGLDQLVDDFVRRYGKPVMVKTEPGRYVVAESGVLLGTVHALKENDGVAYAGTDIGFNVLARPMLYDSWHDIVVYRDGQSLEAEPDALRPVTVVGNICESGDILAKHRLMPPLRQGDHLAVLDAGAYGYAMSSNYNNRLRPAEVLIRQDGSAVLIRRRETLADLMRTCLEI